MPINPKQAQLVGLLNAGTQNGRLIWSETPDETVFRTTLHRGMILVRQIEGVLPGFEVQVLDDRNRVIDVFQSSTEDEGARMEEVFNAARRTALNTDQAWETLLDELRGRVEAAANTA